MIPGCYGDALNVPTFCVDAQGRITSAVDVPISPALVVGTLQTVTDNGSTTTNRITSAGLTLTDQVLLPNGSVGSPSLSFSSSTNTGFYLNTSGSGSVSIVRNGAVKVNISSNTTTFYNNLSIPDGYSADFTGDLNFLQPGSQVRFYDSDNSNFVSFVGPSTVASNVTWTLPSADGTSGQTLSTNGSGTLSWITSTKVVAVPASSTSTGTKGQIAFGTGFFYFYDGVKWLRVAGSTF